MIVPPRLVAGWLSGCAAAVLLAGSTAPAQTTFQRETASGPSLNAPQQSRLGTWNSNRPLRASHAVGAPVSWNTRPMMSGGYVPGHLRTAPVTSEIFAEEEAAPAEIMTDGAPAPESIVEGEPGDILFDHADGDAACCDDGSCGDDACCAPCDCCCCCINLPCIRAPKGFLVGGGVQGFKGPINRGSDSSFGFNESLNWGVPAGVLGGFGAQAGVRGVHSNLSGATDLTTDTRNQLFLTGGLFRRVDWGFQCGAVFDWLHEDWDYSLDLCQVRGELSWVFVTQGEVGFRYTGGVTDDVTDTPAAIAGINWNPVDLYAFFFRQKIAPLGGECQVYAGFSGNSEGLIGGNATLPLSNNVAVAADFAYLMPDVGAANFPIPGSIEESWNVGVGMVFYPEAGFFNPESYYRPLFDVANNGTFMFDRD